MPHSVRKERTMDYTGTIIVTHRNIFIPNPEHFAADFIELYCNESLVKIQLYGKVAYTDDGDSEKWDKFWQLMNEE